jgi:hypothetical protein
MHKSLNCCGVKMLVCHVGYCSNGPSSNKKGCMSFIKIPYFQEIQTVTTLLRNAERMRRRTRRETMYLDFVYFLFLHYSPAHLFLYLTFCNYSNGTFIPAAKKEMYLCLDDGQIICDDKFLCTHPVLYTIGFIFCKSRYLACNPTCSHQSI